MNAILVWCLSSFVVLSTRVKPKRFFSDALAVVSDLKGQIDTTKGQHEALKKEYASMKKSLEEKNERLLTEHIAAQRDIERMTEQVDAMQRYCHSKFL